MISIVLQDKHTVAPLWFRLVHFQNLDIKSKQIMEFIYLLSHRPLSIYLLEFWGAFGRRFL
jgi:hypothetical protein